ncbi:hypothetical protein Q0Z83_000300 [Actinoplanes sichuanensis]|nr:hypothetical protein Q0Z83_000300 [Actinoplanes sichuanensis]
MILALGCLNVGTQELIAQQLRHLVSWLIPADRIVMRANPGLPRIAVLRLVTAGPRTGRSW